MLASFQVLSSCGPPAAELKPQHGRGALGIPIIPRILVEGTARGLAFLRPAWRAWAMLPSPSLSSSAPDGILLQAGWAMHVFSLQYSQEPLVTEWVGTGKDPEAPCSPCSGAACTLSGPLEPVTLG